MPESGTEGFGNKPSGVKGKIKKGIREAALVAVVATDVAEKVAIEKLTKAGSKPGRIWRDFSDAGNSILTQVSGEKSEILLSGGGKMEVEKYEPTEEDHQRGGYIHGRFTITSPTGQTKTVVTLMSHSASHPWKQYDVASITKFEEDKPVDPRAVYKASELKITLSTLRSAAKSLPPS